MATTLLDTLLVELVFKGDRRKFLGSLTWMLSRHSILESTKLWRDERRIALHRLAQVSTVVFVCLLSLVAFAGCGEAEPSPTPTPSPERLYLDSVIRWMHVNVSLGPPTEDLDNYLYGSASIEDVEAEVRLWEFLFAKPIEGTPIREVAANVKQVQSELNLGVQEIKIWLQSPQANKAAFQRAYEAFSYGEALAYDTRLLAVKIRNQRYP